MQPLADDSLAPDDERATPLDVLEPLIEAISAERAQPNAFSLEWLMTRLGSAERQS